MSATEPEEKSGQASAALKAIPAKVYKAIGAAAIVVVTIPAIYANFSQMMSALSHMYKYVSENTDKYMLFADVSMLFQSITTIFAIVLAISYQRKYSRARRRLRYSTNSLEANNAELCGLSERCANTDKALFDIYVKFLEKKMEKEDIIVRSIAIIDEDLQHILDFSAQIFERLTSFPCAVCIKLSDLDGRYKQFTVRHLKRDLRSAKKRDKSNRLRSVSENYADNYVFTPLESGVYGNGVFASNDLKKHNGYYNARVGWGNDYNSTIIGGIRQLFPDSPLPWAGLLCVDNLGGGLDSLASRHYVSIISERVSVLLYRLSVLNNGGDDERSAA